MGETARIPSSRWHVALRFVAPYFLLYSVFRPAAPLDVLIRPTLRKLLELAVEWFTPVAFGVHDVDAAPSGSSDTIADYGAIVLFAIIALLVGTGWTAAARRSSKEADLDSWVWLLVWARYWVAGHLIYYGMVKVFPLQFPPACLLQLTAPVGDLAPTDLLNTFMGQSAAYSGLAGALECVAGTLLLFRRTTIAGALLGAVVMTNVVALNFCFDVRAKLFSTHVLFATLAIASVDRARIFAALAGRATPARPETESPSHPRLRSLLKSVYIVAMFVVVGLPIARIYYYWHKYPAPSDPSLFGVYVVEPGSHCDAERDCGSMVQRVVFCEHGNVAIDFHDGDRLFFGASVDWDEGTLSLYPIDGSEPTDWRLTREQDGRLLLSGVLDAVPHELTLARTREPIPLRDGGFHWVYPPADRPER